MYDRAAQRILAQHPDIARHSLYTAVVCGNLDEVQRILAARPEAAREPGGSRAWTPILYLSYTRFTHTATIDNALEIARLLLDHGANPNDFYMAGDSEYSCLVGAAGEGEQDSPRQPYAETLYRTAARAGSRPVRHPGPLRHAFLGRHAVVARADLPAVREGGAQGGLGRSGLVDAGHGRVRIGRVLRARHRGEERTISGWRSGR